MRDTAHGLAGQPRLRWHDQGDRFVDHTEGDRIQAWCAGATLVKSTGLGHSRVLAAPQLEASIAAFLDAQAR